MIYLGGMNSAPTRWEPLNTMISLRTRALKESSSDIMCYFMYDSWSNYNENDEIAIKTLGDFERVNKILSLMFSQPWQITVYTRKSLEILPGFSPTTPLSPSLSNSRAGLCTQETTSHFPSFHVWNFSCTRHASSTLYSLSWIYKWRLAYKFSAWCHRIGTCSTSDRLGAKIMVRSHENRFSCGISRLHMLQIRRFHNAQVCF